METPREHEHVNGHGFSQRTFQVLEISHGKSILLAGSCHSDRLHLPPTERLNVLRSTCWR